MWPRSLADFTGETRMSGTQTVYMTCPMCGSNSWKLHVDHNTGLWFCFAELHGQGGKVRTGGTSTRTMRDLLPDTQGQSEWPETILPPWHTLSQEAINYLASRGVLREHAQKLRLVEHQHTARILIPYYGDKGHLISWSSRWFGCPNPMEPKYKHSPGPKPLYVLPSWKPITHAVLVEGIFDAIRVHLAVFPEPSRALGSTISVIALGGTTLSARNEADLRTLVTGKLFTLLDNDTAGVRGTQKLRDKLRDQYALHDLAHTLPPGTDPGSATGMVMDSWVREIVRTLNR